MGAAVHVVQKLILQHNPLRKSKKINEKIGTLENLRTKKISSGPSLYYDGFGSYDFKKNVHSIKPVKEIKKNKQKNCASTEFVNEENDHLIKFIL